MLAVALAALALQGTPQQLARLHSLVANVQSFDGLARNVFGPGADAGTKKLDATLARLAKTKDTATIAAQVAILEKQAAALRTTLRSLPATNDAMAADLVHSLTTNVALIRQIAKSLGH